MAIPDDDAWRAVEELLDESGKWVCSDYGVHPWLNFREAYAKWVSSNPPREQAIRDLEEGLEVEHLKLFLKLAVSTFTRGEIPYRFRTTTIGQPDLFVKTTEDRPLLVGIVDFQHTLEEATRRLFTYMLVTGAPFGVLMDAGSIRYAKMSRGDTLQLYLSAPVSAWWPIGFVLQLARDEPPAIGDYSSSLYKIAPRDLHLVERFKSIATQHSPNHSLAIVRGMENLKVEDLEHVFCKWARDTDSSVISAKYKQRQVVLKVRDLSTPWLDVETNLRKVVTEVDAYQTLHRLQGRQIPRVISWGFMCGTMFAYLMTSDEGDALGSYFKFSVRDLQAALHPAHEALAKIHVRGLLHGDISELKILLGRRSSSSSQTSSVKLIGFSTASYVNPKEIHVAAAKEMSKLQQCFEQVLVLVREEEAMAVNRYLSALQRTSSIIQKFPKICDLMNLLGANLQGDDQSSRPDEVAASQADLLPAFFKEAVVVDALTALVDNPELLEEERFHQLRMFLAERRGQSKAK